MKLNNKNFIPLLLGYLGLLPFVIPTVFLLVDHHHILLLNNIQISYGAVILSFLGALHWGVAMAISNLSVTKRNFMLGWSVTPALVAWIAVLMPQTYGLVILSVFFVLAFLIDNTLSQTIAFPAWFIPLRFRLTVVVTSCLMFAAFVTQSMSHEMRLSI